MGVCDRIGTADATLSSVVALYPERALVDAAALTARITRGEEPGPLAGLPVLVKDARTRGASRPAGAPAPTATTRPRPTTASTSPGCAPPVP
ncbi:amidase family protein [Streptomyces sp. NPDC060054]|uniref:amidase family protein n=1 Tax=Streptomyces sp. NPDC060054 TaxID=3347048 RepID=UPI00093BCA7B